MAAPEQTTPNSGTSAWFHKPGETRGALLKRIGYAQELWREAQAKESACRAFVTTKDMMGSNYKTFKRTHQRKFRSRTYGIDETKTTKQTYTRRALFTDPYDDALRADLTDLFDNDGDVFADAAVETRSAMARLIDEVILQSIVDPVQEVNANAADSTTQHITAAGTLTKKVREVIYADLKESTIATADVADVTAGKDTKGLTAATTLEKTNKDTLTRLCNGLRKKDVRSQIYITLTPQLREILELDESFQNAENIYAPKSEAAIKHSFIYRTVMLVDISPNVLPDLDTSNQAASGTTASGATAKVLVNPLVDINKQVHTYNAQSSQNTKKFAARLAEADTNGGAAAATAPAFNGKKAAASGTRRVGLASITKEEIAYFWAKEAIYFASRDELMVSSRDTLPELRLAAQQYDMVAFGAMCIDDNFAGAIVISDGTKKLTTATKSD